MDDHHLWSQGSSLLHQWNYVIISSTDSWGWCLWTFKHIQPTRIWLWLDEKPAALLPPRWWWVSLGFHSCRTQIKRDGGLLTFCELQPISLQLPQSDLISYCWRKKRSLNEETWEGPTHVIIHNVNLLSLLRNIDGSRVSPDLSEHDRMSPGPQEVDNLTGKRPLLPSGGWMVAT